jgi:integrase
MDMASWMNGCKPTRHPGIFETKTGYRVRVRAVDPRTGAQREANREYEGISLKLALLRQEELRESVRRGSQGETPSVKYADYVVSLLKRKIETGELRSAKSRRTWADAQDVHLVPALGEFFVDKIRRVDIEAWKTTQARRVNRGEYSPHTVNGWLRVLLAALREAVAEHDLDYDPTRGIRPLDTSTCHTYTEEEPGSLTVAEVPRFLAKARELVPQHFAMLALGLATGRRPSELRPLRRKGDRPDVIWDSGMLYIRRSETLGEVVERTKTGRRLQIPLPEDLVAILRWHVDALDPGPMRDSDLLFPSVTGSYRAASCLDQPIRAVARAAGISKHLSPKFMRRTFQDLGRAAEVHDFVVRAISGHATVEMQSHYSTVAGDEVRAGLAKVIGLAGFRAALQVAERPGASDSSGDESGERGRALGKVAQGVNGEAE